MSKHAVGDVYESPGGLGFEITGIQSDGSFTVKVDRVYREKGDSMVVRQNDRAIPAELFPGFAAGYKKSKK